MSDVPVKPLRLLSLDGGGVTAISELVILQGLMRSIQKQKELANLPNPHEVFDLIGATGHEGLIALMLGRLRMAIEQALCEYRALVRKVFGKRKMPGKIGKYKAKSMEIAIKDLVARHTRHTPTRWSGKLVAQHQLIRYYSSVYR
ncbi:hypothetical protein N8T08_005699 [Aspergillus melleus]|uniref:Uncharacterized protein n=1 Tax=Aspergillus melleus TaxID=138277 RepID=A0ACC3B355_9EURO|nr:hypothetical protein N8T08_005699 [Aspergillus melleus]